ncbi:MAG: AAA family ATPase [Longibaculum sp.]
MKLESITIENYRQFEKAKLTFDKGVTILAGANNSGKTSLVNLIKNIFVDERLDYSVSDIPAKNIQEWVEFAYPIFWDFFKGEKTVEEVDGELVNTFIPKDEKSSPHLMKTTCIKIHVSYNPKIDDIKLFADYIMDLDEAKHDFFFQYNYEIKRSKFVRAIINDFSKIKRRFIEIEEDKNNLTDPLDEKTLNNIAVKERYLKQLIVGLYVQSTIAVGYYCDKDYCNKCKFDEPKEFRQLFHFCFIKASRPLDDNESDHSHMLSKQMIKMVKLDDNWNELIERLPDELLKPIQEKEIDKTVRDTSLKSLKDTITALEQTNGGKSGELMLDMQVSEEDISDLLQRITTATYNVDGYYLGESSQGLGYSNMIYIHLQLKEYEKNIDPLRVNMFFLEEPESHMHPQMQQVFIKYLLDYYQSNFQGLITTHSNEMVRVVGISHLRVIRHSVGFNSNLYDLSQLLNELKESKELSDDELANFFDWFFEIGYSEIVFADKAIFYEGDTERLFIRKAMTMDKYKKLSQQYVAFIQVGGAYAKNYEKLIRFLGIKSLIITDIDYGKDEISVAEINASETTNATIKHFYAVNHSSNKPTVSNLYAWYNGKENVFDNLIYICFQTETDGYARTLEEAMLNKYFSMNVSTTYKKSEWIQKRAESNLKFSIPAKKDGNKISDDDVISVRDILASTSGSKIDFMYSVILNHYEEKMIPKYIDGGLSWLME